MNKIEELKELEDEDSVFQLRLDIRKYHLNIPQIERAVTHEILHYEDYLCREIRVVGLRDKITKRLVTLKRILEIIEVHDE